MQSYNPLFMILITVRSDFARIYVSFVPKNSSIMKLLEAGDTNPERWTESLEYAKKVTI